MEQMMTVQFLTKVNASGKNAPAGTVHKLPTAQAQGYINRGLAIAAQAAEEEKTADTKTAKVEAEAKTKPDADSETNRGKVQ